MSYDFRKQPSIIRSRIIHSRIPRRFRGTELSDLDTYEGETRVKVEAWLEKMLTGKIVVADGELLTCGKGMLLAGPPGSGKSFIASVAAQTVIRTMPEILWREPWLRTADVLPSAFPHPVMYFTYPEILATIKRGWDRDLEDKDRGLMDCVFGHGDQEHRVRLLVIDDLGKEYKSDWSAGTFDHLLRERFDAGLPTIVTTNVPQKDWATAYSPAMASFAHDAFYSVPLVYGETGDRRKRRRATV